MTSLLRVTRWSPVVTLLVVGLAAPLTAKNHGTNRLDGHALPGSAGVIWSEAALRTPQPQTGFTELNGDEFMTQDYAARVRGCTAIGACGFRETGPPSSAGTVTINLPLVRYCFFA